MSNPKLPASQRILVIGASGATGHELCVHLSREGHEVTAFMRRPGSLADLARATPERDSP